MIVKREIKRGRLREELKPTEKQEGEGKEIIIYGRKSQETVLGKEWRCGAK